MKELDIYEINPFKINEIETRITSVQVIPPEERMDYFSGRWLHAPNPEDYILNLNTDIHHHSAVFPFFKWIPFIPERLTKCVTSCGSSEQVESLIGYIPEGEVCEDVDKRVVLKGLLGAEQIVSMELVKVVED